MISFHRLNGCSTLTESESVERTSSLNDSGFYVDDNDKALNVSASDLERYVYCPLSWQLAKDGSPGKGEAIEEGKIKHAKIHSRIENFKTKQLELRKALVIWSWWFTIILVFVFDAVLFYILDDETRTPEYVSQYLTMLSLTWLLFAIIAIYLPWRKYLKFDSNNEEYNEIKNFDDTIIPFTFQPLGFLGGWGEGGRVEAGLLFGAIICILHAIGLTYADDKRQAGFILASLAMVWTLIASWQLQKALLADNELETAKISAGISDDVDVTYSDDEETADLLVDEESGLRGRPDQIVIVDGEFIPVEQKTGKIPERPHKSHEIQLLAYLHLVEKTTGRKPPYGVLKYGNENLHQIYWTNENYEYLMDKTKEIQKIMIFGGAKRNHERVGKCQNCSRRYACDSSLV